jgi:hypothetical protein
VSVQNPARRCTCTLMAHWDFITARLTSVIAERTQPMHPGVKARRTFDAQANGSYGM